MSSYNPLKATSPSVIGSTQDDDDDGLTTSIGPAGSGGSGGATGIGPTHTFNSGINYGHVNFSGGAGITFTLTQADDDSVDMELPIVDESIVMIEDLGDDASYSTTLPAIQLLAFDERHGPISLTFTPEKSISVYELLLINQLIFTEFHKPGQVDVLAFVRHNNLEKHFTISMADV
jgi:hypothetical protein